jgi:hypothetical protein
MIVFHVETMRQAGGISSVETRLHWMMKMLSCSSSFLMGKRKMAHSFPTVGRFLDKQQNNDSLLFQD